MHQFHFQMAGEISGKAGIIYESYVIIHFYISTGASPCTPKRVKEKRT
jgi:hypothetical protein